MYDFLNTLIYFNEIERDRLPCTIHGAARLFPTSCWEIIVYRQSIKKIYVFFATVKYTIQSCTI